MMANVGFNGTHQKIVFDVTDRFYQLGTARQKVMVTQSALDAAKTVEQAAQARFDNGLATKPELLQAQQQSAQSNFDVQASLGAESDARVALIESIGLLPTVQLKVADLPEQSDRGRQTADSVGELITKALAQRPDLVAKLANVRSKEYEIRRIRAEYYPKVTLDAHFTETDLEVSVAKSDYFGGTRPTFGAFLTMNVPIFDGFARRHKLDMAEADLHQAENELAGARDSAARDVWKAYTGYRTALKKQDAAEKLVTASKSAFDAVLDSYKQGLSTYTEVVTAERNLTAALATSHDTQAAIYTTQAAARTERRRSCPPGATTRQESHEDENGICASRPGQQQQSSTSPARSVSAGRACWVAPAHRGIGVRGSTVESPLTYDRYPRFRIFRLG